MNAKTKYVGAVLALVAMAFFAAWPFWKWVSLRPVRNELRARAESLVEKNPQLQPA